LEERARIDNRGKNAMTEETLFQEALTRTPAERAVFLAQACAGQPELQKAVEKLLAAHEKSGNLLDQAPANLHVTVVPDVSERQPAHGIDQSPPAEDGRVLETTHGGDPRRDPSRIVAGRYVLLDKLGEGGMGEVWAAKQTEPVRRKVAVKLIKVGMDSRAVLMRFEQERQALAMMEHPNIAKVLDGGMTDDRRPYFVMELVNGLPLNKFCDEARLGIRERLELFAQVCQAVQHAHQKGIIHRDLKPSNILVTIIDGRPIPKVIDFGVVKATSGRLTDESLNTQFGTVVGTLEYMSPEQAGFSGVDIDTRSDIYSLGVILYELLTGLRPIDATRLKKAAMTELIRMIREEEPSRPSKRLSTDDGLPSLAALRQMDPRRLMTVLRGELDWVVMKCLEKQRDRRYETAGALSRDVQRYLADEPVEARPPSATYRMRKFVRRHSGRVIAAGLTIVTLIAVAGFLMVGALYAQAERERREEIAARDQAIEQRQLADNLRSVAELAAAKAAASDQASQRAAQEASVSREQVRQILYATDIQLAWNHWDANRAGRMTELLQRHRPAAGDRDYRGFEWHYLWRLAHGAQRTLHGHQQPVHSLTFAGSNDVLLSGDLEYQYRQPGTVRKWRPQQNDEPVTLFTQTAAPQYADYYPGVRSLSTSPDGTTCALVDAGNVRLLDVESGRLLRVLEGLPGKARSVVFAPDGTQLAVGDTDGMITVWDIQTGEKTATLEKHRMSILCMAFSADGKRLAAGGGDEGQPTWSQMLNGELRLWEVESQKLLGECRAVRSLLRDVSFNRQGTTIAAATEEGTVVLWDVNRLDGGRILRGHTGSVAAVRWLPDGRFLASAGDDGLIRVWDIGLEQENRLFQGHNGAVTALAVSDEGSLLASGGRDGTIRLWDPHVDPLRTMISDFPWAIGTVEFSQDSRWLMIATYSQVTLCDTQRFAKRHVFPIDHWVFDTHVSPDGRLFATAGNQETDGEEPGVVKIWDVATGTAKFTLDPQMLSAKYVAFSADGQHLACSGPVESSEPGSSAVTVWDVATGRQLLHRANAVSFDFGPDSRTLAAAGRGGLWTLETHGGDSAKAPIVSREFHEVKYSPDGQSLALLDADGQLSLWWIADSREQVLGRANRGLTFSQDGSRLAAFGESAAQVWDVTSGREVSSIPMVVDHLRFMPDGRSIVTAGREIHLWQAETGRELLNLGEYAPSGVNRVAISPDGTRLAAGGGYRDEHSGVWVWLAPMDAAVED
jgi:WD40 repeat protein/serine/threonine protein kinase